MATLVQLKKSIRDFEHSMSGMFTASKLVEEMKKSSPFKDFEQSLNDTLT